MVDILYVFDSVTLITLSTLCFAFLGVLVRTCFLSKCSKCAFYLFWDYRCRTKHT